MKVVKIEELTQEDIGRRVIYKPGFENEEGKIKSWNDKFVFVVYRCDNQWDRFQDYIANATVPEDLVFWEKNEKNSM